MTPTQEVEIDMMTIEKKTIPSLTWKINEERAEVRGTVDEGAAMKQAVNDAFASFDAITKGGAQ